MSGFLTSIALGANGTPGALPFVQTAITADPAYEVQYAATLSLVELLGASSLPICCDLITTTQGTNRQAVLQAVFHATNYLHIDLEATGQVDALIDALAAALHDADPQARMAAVWPLAWLRAPRAADVLTAAHAHEGDPAVRDHIRRVATSLVSPAAAQLQ